MHTTQLLLCLLSVYCALALPNPAPWPAEADAVAAPPSQFTANPSIGGGLGSYKDSAHFRAYNVSSSTVDNTLKIMEAAHACFVDTLGWRTPGLSWKDTSNSGPWYKMNVYQVAEGSMPGADAQTLTDANAGLTFMKVVDQYVTAPDVIIREFGRSMTYSEKNWINQTRTYAWWDGLANYFSDTWIATDTCEVPKAAANLPSGDSIIDLNKVISESYLVLVDGTPGTGNHHQYWPFLAYITNNPDGYPGLGKSAVQDMIRKYDIDSNETPLHTLERNVRAAGGPIIQRIVSRYYSRMAFLDIGDAKISALYSSQSKTLNYDNMDSNGDGKWTVKSARAPRYMGANIIPLNATSTRINVVITLNPVGSGTFFATLAVKGSEGVRYVDTEFGGATVSVASGEEVSLVVTNAPALEMYDPFNIPEELNKGLNYTVQISGATVA